MKIKCGRQATAVDKKHELVYFHEKVVLKTDFFEPFNVYSHVYAHLRIDSQENVLAVERSVKT